MTGIWVAIAGMVLVLLIGLGLRVWRRRHGDRSLPSSLSTGVTTAAIGLEDMEPLIKDAAERWAAAHGRPEAAGLVADKLRTLYDISYGEQSVTTRRRWWS